MINDSDGGDDDNDDDNNTTHSRITGGGLCLDNCLLYPMSNEQLRVELLVK
jgi:hypothetical protein